MNATYYETPEMTVLTCSIGCLSHLVDFYARRGYTPYRNDDGTLLMETDADTRLMLLHGEIPAPHKCDYCRETMEGGN